jgi:lipid A 3-O-deacylase
MKKNILLLCIILFGNFSISGVMRLSAENDLLFHKDGWYTHGTWLSYMYASEKTNDHWLIKKPITQKRISAGQYMYTPDDISIPELIKEDRPYGGVLYFEYSEYMESKNRMQSISIITGVVGPCSQADKTQTWIHDIFNNQTPRGWDNQLNNEVVLNAGYTDRYRFYHNKWVDLIGRYGVVAGNLNTHASLGSLLKFGWNVPSNYDIISLEPVPRKNLDGFLKNYNLFGFFDIEGRAISYNIFLDGNTFSESHNVDKEYFVGDLIMGATLGIHRFEVTYSINLRSDEFEGQYRSSKWSGISLAYQF